MKININKKSMDKEVQELLKFQEGGVAPEATPVEQAPADAGQGASPEEQILQAAAQAVQTQDAQLALQVCQALVEMAGGGASQATAQGEPVYRKGGTLKYRRK